MSTCILVLGQPRSGTSAVAGVVECLGVPMSAPDCRGDASDANPKGFFSDSEVEAFFNSHFGTYFPTAITPLTAAEKTYFRDIIARRAVNDPWGLKEWRVACYLPQFIQAAGDVRIIKTDRDPQRSLNSWLAHFQRLDVPTLADVNRAVTFLNNAVAASGVPVLNIDFDTALDNKIQAVNDIATFIGKPVTDEALAMIDETYRRF